MVEPGVLCRLSGEPGYLLAQNPARESHQRATRVRPDELNVRIARRPTLERFDRSRGLAVVDQAPDGAARVGEPLDRQSTVGHQTVAARRVNRMRVDNRFASIELVEHRLERRIAEPPVAVARDQGDPVCLQCIESVFDLACYQQAIFLTGTDNPSQWSAAVDVLSRAVELDPLFASALAYLAQSQVRLLTSDWPVSRDAVDRAERAAQRAIALRPDLAIVQMASGSVAAARGNWVEAEEERFRSAAALDEDWLLVGDVHSAHVLLSAGHLRRALELSRASQRRGNGMIGIVLIHGVTYLATDNDAEARDAMALIAAMGGQAHRPHIAGILSRLAHRAGRLDDAVRLLQASLSDTMRAAGGEAVIARVMAASAERSLAPSAVDAIDDWVARIGFEHLAQTLRHDKALLARHGAACGYGKCSSSGATGASNGSPRVWASSSTGIASVHRTSFVEVPGDLVAAAQSSYWNTSARGTPNAREILNAASSDGE